MQMAMRFDNAQGAPDVRGVGKTAESPDVTQRPKSKPRGAEILTPEPSDDALSMAARELPHGSVVCLCNACGRYFLSVRAFDAHQGLTANGDVICHRPGTTKGTRTMVLVERAGFWWWAFPKQAGPDRGKFAKNGDDA